MCVHTAVLNLVLNLVAARARPAWVRGPSEYWFFSVSIGFSRNKRAVTSQPVDFFAIGLRIRNPRGKPVLKTL